LFDKGSQQRKVSLNTNYIVIFNNTLDNYLIRAMSSQMYAKNSWGILGCNIWEIWLSCYWHETRHWWQVQSAHKDFSYDS